MNKILSCNQYRLTSIIVIINSFTAMVTVDNHNHSIPKIPIPQHDYGLSNREQEVIELIAQEHSNKEIATLLYITVGTVETHRRNIFQKMGAKNMAGVINRAYKCGILKVE